MTNYIYTYIHISKKIENPFLFNGKIQSLRRVHACLGVFMTMLTTVYGKTVCSAQNIRLIPVAVSKTNNIYLL